MNNRVLKDTLQPCFCGFCLLRIIHIILSMRIKWPSKLILIGKTDLYAAYRCVHANAKIALTYISIVVKLAFICLRLPFGTAPAPAEYTTISEAEIELGDDLPVDTSLDETNPQSSHRHLLPREDYIPASDPLVNVDQLSVNIEEKGASIDIFIDDIITITIDNPFWIECAKNSALLFIRTIFIPLHYDEPLKRDDPLSLYKLM